MSQKLRRKPDFRRFDRHGLRAGPAPIFQRRNTIRIIGYQDDSLDGSVGRVSGYVETYAHIDSLLLKVCLEVRIGELRGVGHWSLLRLVTTKFQDSTPNRGEIFVRELVEPASED